MNEHAKKLSLDSLLRRREVLSALYKKQRIKIEKSSTQQKEAGAVLLHMPPRKNIKSDSSDVIEDSDTEPPPIKRSKIPKTVLDSSASNSDDTINTSMISLSLSHSFFGNAVTPINSPVKADPDKKIHVISNQLIKKSYTERDKSTSPISAVLSSRLSAAANVDTSINSLPPSVNNNETVILSAPDHLNSDLNTLTPLRNNADAVDQALSVPNHVDHLVENNNINVFDPGFSDPAFVDIVLNSTTFPEPAKPVLSGLGDKIITNTVSINNSSCTDTPSINNSNAATPSTLFDEVTTSKKIIKLPARTLKKEYLDFLSDDDTGDFSAGSSDVWTHGSESESSEEENLLGAKRKTKKLKKIRKIEQDVMKKKKILKINKRKVERQSRKEGKEYVTITGNVVTGKKMQKNPCFPEKCKRGCYNITEDKRCSLFNFFWNLDVQRRKDWLVRSSRIVPCDRKRTDSLISRRNITYEYYVNNGEDHQKVCQKFLLSTLDISQKFLLYTLSNSKDEMAQKDQRRPHTTNKYSDLAKINVREFIEKLPAVPSHYNRKNTNRMYLPQELKNISNIYRIYLKECRSSNIEFVSESLFRSIFTGEYNISFHTPKKDKCNLCVKTERNEDLSESDRKHLQEHLHEKQATYKRFRQHQFLPILKNDTVVCTFDLQKILNTPYGDSVVLYYSRKYPVFNFTMYESVTQEVFCYLWGECDAKRGANEIATCLFSYLKSVDERGIRNLLFYCDSCPGQNKNKTILSLFNYFLMKSKNLEIIQINYLLPGHTYMPVDSVHATIEREVKKITVWSPTQWPSYIEAARKKPKPYKVNVLEHTDFLNWDEIANQTFTNETSKNLRIRNVRVVTLKKKNPNEIYIKYSMKQDSPSDKVMLYQISGRKQKNKGKGKGKSRSRSTVDNPTLITYSKVMNMIPTKLYKQKLHISEAKYRDLKRLCNDGIIPKRYHDYYLNLSHGDVIDTLTLTDEEDEEECVEETTSS